MALSAYEIILFCFEIFLYSFHLSLLILLFIKKKTVFNGPFYNIFRVVLIADLTTFIMAIVNSKLSLLPIFIPFYAKNEYFASICLNISTYFAVLQFIGHSMMALNRFTLIFFPLQQQSFWRRPWYIYLLLFLPFLRICWRLHEPAIFNYSANETIVSPKFISAEVTLISVISSLVIYICTTFLAAIFNILAIGKFYFQKKTIVNVKEKSLLFVSMMTFFAQLLRTAYTATNYFLPLSANLGAFFSLALPYIVDIFALTGSISLIILCKAAQEQYMSLYFGKSLVKSHFVTGHT